MMEISVTIDNAGVVVGVARYLVTAAALPQRGPRGARFGERFPVPLGGALLEPRAAPPTDFGAKVDVGILGGWAGVGARLDIAADLESASERWSPRDGLVRTTKQIQRRRHSNVRHG